MKVVINDDFGGFSLSKEATEFIAKRKGEDLTEAIKEHGDRSIDLFYKYHYVDLPREDIDLVTAVETLGDKANGNLSDLCIEEVPDEYGYYIHDYEGCESVILKVKRKTIISLFDKGDKDGLIKYLEGAGII